MAYGATGVAKQESAISLAKVFVRLPAVMGIVAAALFVSAGRLDWLRGWVCLLLYTTAGLVNGILVYKHNPALFEARARGRHADTKRFDKVLLAIFFPLTIIQPAVAGLDVVRFRWSALPPALIYPGVLLFVAAFALITWAMLVNPHAEATVRIQSDRGHTRVTSGPYRFVRHPMYLGMIFVYVATALILGSPWALAVSAVIAIVLICRTALEDRTLRAELAGYADYAAVTRYRLVPGLW